MITRRERWLTHAILVVLALSVVLPVGWLLLAALSPYANAGVDLADLRPGNFVTAWRQSEFGLHLRNSVIICAAVVTSTTILSVLAGFGLTVLRVPGRRVIFPLFLAGIMIPFEGILVPLYYNLRAAGLTNLGGLILAHTGLGLPFGVFWMRATFAGIPGELIEAAELDGAGALRQLWSIVVPVVRSALLTMILLMVMWTWNDYFLAFVLVANDSQLPVTVALGSFSTKYTQQLNLMAAAAVLVSLPILGLYLVFQRHFVSGVLAGALKS